MYHDDFDRLTGVRYNAETADRYTYKYGANGLAAVAEDTNLGITSRTEYDLSDRPCRTEKIDSYGDRIQQTSLKYDKLGNLAHFTEELSEEEIHRSSYTYDRDNRITEIAYDPKDNAADTAEVNKVAYTYDALGRVATRAITSGENTQTATYAYVNGGHGTNSTTPLVESIQQPGVSFDYAYDNRGNIISEKRYAQGAAEADKLETTYAYDALGQLIRVNDPHENATWVYTYDRGGNILNKTRYAYTTGELGTPVEYVPYAYGDANWKDKLTAYNGIPITYDAIGNPLNDGERVYTWGAGRQLKHVSMAVTGSASGLHISNGSNAESQTMLQIIASNENSVLTAHIIRNGREITDECADSAFTWTCTGGSSTRFPLHAKQISLTSAETAVGVQIACAYSETMCSYGTVQVDNNLTASHTPSTADANDTFVIGNGKLKVTTASANGTDYTLNNGRLIVNNGFTGTITSTAAFTSSAQTREIDYTYDHNGLRTRKRVVENVQLTITDYTLHGKLITHMTRRTAPISETVIDKAIPWVWQKMHFFYDAQSRPAFVEYNGTKYRYLHNLQGDIIGIVDGNGNLVVEYRYDAWGKPISITGTLKTTLGELNPFRYRGYVYDGETGLYYLRSRYYDLAVGRFVNADAVIDRGYSGATLFTYCRNKPIGYCDESGNRPFEAKSISTETSAQRKESFRMMKAMLQKRNAKKKALKSMNSTLQKAINEYMNITNRSIAAELFEAGYIPSESKLEVSAVVRDVPNSASYAFTDAMSFFGVTGVSDAIAGAIEAMFSYYTGCSLPFDAASQFSSIISCVGQVSEQAASIYDNGTHKQYTVYTIATSGNSTTVIWCKFDEGVYYNGLDIFGMSMPDSSGFGVTLF